MSHEKASAQKNKFALIQQYNNRKIEEMKMVADGNNDLNIKNWRLDNRKM